MARTRRKFTAEFKVEAVKLVVEKGYSFAEAAQTLDVGENSLRCWKAAFDDRAGLAFPGNGRVSPADDELHRLRAENKRLRAEREILKKAAAFFAKEAT